MKLTLAIVWLAAPFLWAQTTLPLYPSAIPNSKPTAQAETIELREGMTLVGHITQPTLTIYRPDKPSGTAVILCPGGGYWINALVHEGHDVARQLQQWGITAIVLKYRIPNEQTMLNKEIGPLQDAQQAIKTVRERAAELGIKPTQVGIMGFSAGGHLAAMASTRFNKPVIDHSEGVSLRPDFSILIYPVISFTDSIGHRGSRNQLLGENPPVAKILAYSAEHQVTQQTPRAFLVHASNDDAVRPDNSIAYYQQLLRYGVPAELHLYQAGGHGFGMQNSSTADAWMERLRNWMRANGWLP